MQYKKTACQILENNILLLRIKNPQQFLLLAKSLFKM